MRLSLSVLIVGCCFVAVPGRAEESPEAVVAIVNGTSLTAGQLQLQVMLEQLPEQASAAEQKQALERLIDRELIRQYLEKRQVSADPQQLASQHSLIEKVIVKRGGRVSDVLARLHLSEQSLRAHLALPLAWDAHVRSVLTEQQIANEWNAHRMQFDGTRLKGSQIVRTLGPTASDTDWKDAESLLAEVRRKITDRQLTFAQAAKEYSQSPSGTRGGDLGEFEYRGRVDVSISEVAFRLEPGQISTPFRTRFGVHLVEVRERIPGQLNLEDARPELFQRLSEKLWREQVEQERQAAKIQWVNAPAESQIER